MTAAAKKIVLLTLLVLLFGCAGEIQRPGASQATAEKERPEGGKDSAMPTFTYRPGS